ncbi:hypothetical protein KZZ52_39765 [Dactylosporangium sp. AC04546]|uniref:hypothetical protein n=1 Tax=Dactylosporangium sp. AC04546 TaxID=2862460 RepID=UPI001EDFD07C|nr:hypothetical protein [Dactylosporangium sp. AC04546]WVK80087.1 hypothetical protein KZZ52_39765 [Dactylosporangium sp. AC04546]
MKVIGTMQTADGAWRVEVVRHGSGSRWYRLVHGDNTIDYLTITRVTELLTQAGIDLGDLSDPAA